MSEDWDVLEYKNGFSGFGSFEMLLQDFQMSNQNIRLDEQPRKEPDKKEEKRKGRTDIFSQLDSIVVKQKKDLIEVFVAYEIPNHYYVTDMDGVHLLDAQEYSCHHRRQYGGHSFTIKIKNKDNVEVIRLQKESSCACRPINCCGQMCWERMEVQSPPGKTIGHVYEAKHFVCRLHRFNILDPDFKEILYISEEPSKHLHAILHFTSFKIHASDGSQIGIIAREYPWSAHAAFTDADTYQVTFPKDLHNDYKKILLGASMLIDYCFFEDTSEQMRND